MSKQTEALKLALKALEKYQSRLGLTNNQQDTKAITAIREALAHAPTEREQPRGEATLAPATELREQQSSERGEPVAVFDEHLGRPKMLSNAPMLTHGQGLYTSPQPSKPVAHMNQNGVIHPAGYEWEGAGNILTPLYKSPQSKPWVGLTDEERATIFGEFGLALMPVRKAIAEDIEAKLKEKNC